MRSVSKFLNTKLGSPRTIQACHDLGIDQDVFSEKVSTTYHGPKWMKNDII